MQSPLNIANDALSRIGDDLITSIDGADETSVLCKQFYDRCWEEILAEYPWDECLKRIEALKAPEIDVSNAADGDAVIVNDTVLTKGTDWSSAATLAVAITALDNVIASASGDVVTSVNDFDYDLVISKTEGVGKILLSSDYDFTAYRYTFPTYAERIYRIFDVNGTDITADCELRNRRIFTDKNYIYVEYVDNYGILLDTYGSGSPAPPSYVQQLTVVLLASKIAFRITQNVELAGLLANEYRIRLAEAKARNNPIRARNSTKRWINEG